MKIKRIFLMIIISTLLLQTAVFGKAITSKWDQEASYVAGQRVNASIDTKVKPKGCAYSIKIVNKQIGCTNVNKTFKVNKNTHYRASVKAKYVGYVESAKWKTKSGASLGKHASYSGSERYQGSGWKELVYEFDTQNETEYTLALWNGMFCADCKGTAYYADFKLEECKAKKTNEWNIMLVFFNNVKANVMMNGKTYLQDKHYTNKDITYISNVVKHSYVSIPTLSEDKWKIKCIDVYKSNKTITASDLKYSKDLGGYYLDHDSKTISKELSRILKNAQKQSGKTYNQIVVFSPLNGINGNWLGLGGGTYQNINFCQLIHDPGREDYTQVGNNYYESAIVHEILHCVNRISNGISPKQTVLLHENIGVYAKNYTMHGQNGWDNWGSWHADYMRRQTPDKKGIDEKSYLVYNQYKYKTIYGNKKKTSYKKTDVTTLKIADIKAQIYVGRELKPKIVVKNGKTKLKEGKDYLVSYIENKGVGKACVVIKGKGKYTGSVCKLFAINPKAPILAGEMAGGKYHFTWTKSADATYYELSYSTDGGKNFSVAKKIDAKLLETELVLPARSYQFKIKACKDLYPQKFRSADSNEISL